MEANYNDVVPRRDFVALEAKANGYLERIKEFQGTYDTQQREIEQLHAQNEYEPRPLVSNFLIGTFSRLEIFAMKFNDCNANAMS